MIEKIKKYPFLFGVLVIYIVLFIVNAETAMAAIGNTGYYLKEMLIIMPVVFLLTALIDAWIPRDLIMNALGEKSGLKGSFIAIGLGSISAGPIYAAFPVAKTLLKKGASISNIVVILSAWAVIKIPMLANEAKFLSPKFMIVRWILTVIGIIIMGYVVSKLVEREDIPLDEDELVKGEIRVNREACIGCGVCANVAPGYFKMEDNKAIVIKDIGKGQEEKPIEAMEKCPVNAIDIGQLEKLKAAKEKLVLNPDSTIK